MIGNAFEKNKGGKGVRVGKFVVLNRAVRAGLAETFIQGWGGRTQVVAGVCKVIIFVHKALPSLCFLIILFP